MSNLIGQSLGRYHILEGLGEGGMAFVYKAYDTRLEADVAVKVIRTEALPQNAVERALKRFEREAKALARLTHPNIVKVTDFGEHGGKPYLVMPYLPGGTLKQLLKNQPMAWNEAAHLLLPIARALDYAHRRGTIHRDVKPSNILITEDGEPMLTDFGIAKIIDEEVTMDLTGTSAAVGTPEYMAPEQVTARNVDHRADIYALGVVFYEMVTGRKPFTADTPMAVLFKHASEPLPRPKGIVPSLPDAVEKILLKALAKDPAERYADMGAFAAALEAAMTRAASRAPARAEPLPRGKTRDHTLATVDQEETPISPSLAAAPMEPRAKTSGAEAPKTAPPSAPRAMTWQMGVGMGLAALAFFVMGLAALAFFVGYLASRPAAPPPPPPTFTPTRAPTNTPPPTVTFTMVPVTVTQTEFIINQFSSISEIKSSWENTLYETFSAETSNWDPDYYKWKNVESGKYKLECDEGCFWGVGLARPLKSDKFLLEFDVELIDNFACTSSLMLNEVGIKTCGFVAVALNFDLFVIIDLTKGELSVSQDIWLEENYVLSPFSYSVINSGNRSRNNIKLVKYDKEVYIIVNDDLLDSFSVDGKRIDYFEWVFYNDTSIYIDNVLLFENR